MKKNNLTQKLVIITVALIAFIGVFGFFKWQGSQKPANDIPKIVWQDYTYVYDEADLLSNGTEQTLNNQLSSLYNSQKGQVIVLTINSLNGQSLEAYANTVFEKTGIGDKDRDDGLLLLIVKDEKRVRLEVGQGLEGDLNDGKVGRILDENFLPYRAKNDYDTAVTKTISAISDVLTAQERVPDASANVESQNTNEVSNHAKSPLGSIIIAVIVIFVIIVLIATGHGDILLWLLLMIFNNRGGGRGGGSYGGGSSGGGFGGGSSSGGGASR